MSLRSRKNVPTGAHFREISLPKNSARTRNLQPQDDPEPVDNIERRELFDFENREANHEDGAVDHIERVEVFDADLAGEVRSVGSNSDGAVDRITRFVLADAEIGKNLRQSDGAVDKIKKSEVFDIDIQPSNSQKYKNNLHESDGAVDKIKRSEVFDIEVSPSQKQRLKNNLHESDGAIDKITPVEVFDVEMDPSPEEEKRERIKSAFSGKFGTEKHPKTYNLRYAVAVDVKEEPKKKKLSKKKSSLNLKKKKKSSLFSRNKSLTKAKLKKNSGKNSTFGTLSNFLSNWGRKSKKERRGTQIEIDDIEVGSQISKQSKPEELEAPSFDEGDYERERLESFRHSFPEAIDVSNDSNPSLSNFSEPEKKRLLSVADIRRERDSHDTPPYMKKSSQLKICSKDI